MFEIKKFKIKSEIYKKALLVVLFFMVKNYYEQRMLGDFQYGFERFIVLTE